MESFNYLSVLLAIILGLAITQVLQGLRGLILTRAKVKLYFPTLIWCGLVLLMTVQGWWASFSMRTHSNWTFLALLIIVLHATSLYMVAALVLPDVTGEKVVDLREHYFAHRPWFYSATLSAVIFSAGKDLALNGRLPGPMNAEFHIVFGVASIVAIITRRAWVHQFLAPVMGLVFLFYIGLLFARL